jgi:hypothetical protein
MPECLFILNLNNIAKFSFTESDLKELPVTILVFLSIGCAENNLSLFPHHK